MYTKRSVQYKQNKMLHKDAKRFYRDLGKKNLKIEGPQDIQETK